MRECTGLSLVKIGEIFGGRDHTTVLHGIKKVEDEMRARDATFRQVQDLTTDRPRPRARGRMNAVENHGDTAGTIVARIGARTGGATELLHTAVPMSDRRRYAAGMRPFFHGFHRAYYYLSLRRTAIEAGGVDTVKFRCDRDALSEALQTVQRGVSSQARDPGADRRPARGRRRGAAHAHHHRPRGLGAARDRRAGDRGRASRWCRRGCSADTVKSLSDAPVEFETDQSQARIRCAAYEGVAPAAAGRGLPGPAGARRHARRGRGRRVRRGRVPGGARRQPRRGAAGAHGRARRDVSREGCVLVATDSYRLAVRELVATADGEAKAIVPERALSEAGRAAATDEKGAVEIFVDEAQVSFRAGGLTLTSRPDRGRVPELPRSCLPEGHESRLTVSRQQLLDAVRRVGLLARDTTPVRLEFNALGVKLSSAPAPTSARRSRRWRLATRARTSRWRSTPST